PDAQWRQRGGNEFPGGPVVTGGPGAPGLFDPPLLLRPLLPVPDPVCGQGLHQVGMHRFLRSFGAGRPRPFETRGKDPAAAWGGCLFFGRGAFGARQGGGRRAGGPPRTRRAPAAPPPPPPPPGPPPLRPPACPTAPAGTPPPRPPARPHRDRWH